MNKSQIEFPISIYGKLTQVNDTLSKARCRIFYKGANRNGTFITDEFAKELISTLHYVPVKGIYDGDDYTDHGQERREGQIYGIVPVDNNFAWERHLDEDGVERTYACSDVLLFTALYPEAGEIAGKSQSMELYDKSLSYHIATMNDQQYIVFEHGSFLGLQVLGDDVEPCFEGASFFSLQQSITDTIQKIKEFSNAGGKSEMPTINFKLSDNQKYQAIWSMLNTDYTEENGWAVSYSVCEVYDDYALVFNLEENCYERVYYKKCEEEDKIEFVCKKKCYVMDITEDEKATLDVLRQLNGDTYELVNENLEHAQENADKCVELNSKLEEMNETFSTLNIEVENAKASYTELENQYNEAKEQFSALTEEVESLREYKLNIETQHKEAVVAEYADKLSDEVLDTYKANLAEYTAEDLDMHLAYELKKTNSLLLNATPNQGRLPKEVSPRSDVEEYLSRYKR